jgi:hypothetical protein
MSKVIILPNLKLQQDASILNISNKSFVYTGESLLQLNKFDNGFSSFFVDQNIIKDGVLYTATPFDPLFVALPYLQSKTTFSSISDLLYNPETPHLEYIAPLFSRSNLSLICDSKFY